eukprot:2226768-Pyramimonas_sp.AAC.1
MNSSSACRERALGRPRLVPELLAVVELVVPGVVACPSVDPRCEVSGCVVSAILALLASVTVASPMSPCRVNFLRCGSGCPRRRRCCRCRRGDSWGWCSSRLLGQLRRGHCLLRSARSVAVLTEVGVVPNAWGACEPLSMAAWETSAAVMLRCWVGCQ